jgi:hypothetical protein
MGTSWIGHFTWKYLFFRDETIRTSAPQINKNSMEIENYIFQKAKSKVSSFHLLEDCFSLGDRAFLYLKHFVIDIYIFWTMHHDIHMQEEPTKCTLYSLMIEFSYIVFDMFQTTECSSSGRLYKQLYRILSCIYISSLVTVRMCLILMQYQTHPDRLLI